MKIHRQFFLGIISAAPALFLVGLTMSFVLYYFFPWPIFKNALVANSFIMVGAVLILLSTSLAFMAQRISRTVTNPKYKATCPDLMQGPYAHSRHPGSLSLFGMFLGFTLVANSLVMLVLAFALFLLLTVIFIPAQEKSIASLCPEAYAEYKQKVRMWL